MARKHYGKPFDEYKKPSKPTGSKPAKPIKKPKTKPKTKPKPKPKPKPRILGSGLAQSAASKISEHQKRTKARIDKMFK